MKAGSSQEITQKLWGEAARGERKTDVPVNWLGSSLVVREIINPRISGDPNLDWLEWVQREFIREIASDGFVLGCGGGNLERRAAKLGICRSFYGVDLAPDAVGVARALAEREGWSEFRYEALDANKIRLEPKSLDLILSDMALHHITELEHVLDQFARALRSNGLLVLNEFVGPDRFQWTDRQLALATECIRELPLRLRRNRDVARWKRTLKPYVFRAKRWPPEKVARMDPSESVRSSEILRLVSERFRIARRADYGGTLLALILNNIAGNFTDSPANNETLRSLAEKEWRLIASDSLPSDYTLLVAHPKQAPS